MTLQSDISGQHLIGVLSDAHGNGPAFDRAIALLKSLGAHSFMFLGDAVGYIPSLSVVASLRELGSRVRCIKGNHEQMLLECRCDSSKDAVYQLSTVRSLATPEDLKMLATWVPFKKEELTSETVLWVHGSPIAPTDGYVYPDSDLSLFQPNAAVVFMGHTHRPFVRDCEGVRYVNVGSCGLPRDDGRFGSAALYDPLSGSVRVIRFDITAETEAILANNPDVHSSVHELFMRRSEAIFGDVVS